LVSQFNEKLEFFWIFIDFPHFLAVTGGRGENDARAAGDQERGQAGPQAAFGGEGGQGYAEQYCAVPGRHAGHHSL